MRFCWQPPLPLRSGLGRNDLNDEFASCPTVRGALLLYQIIAMLGSRIPSVNKLVGQAFAFHPPQTGKRASACAGHDISPGDISWKRHSQRISRSPCDSSSPNRSPSTPPSNRRFVRGAVRVRPPRLPPILNRSIT
jgi:hypothetical protein